mgnify:FL=1
MFTSQFKVEKTWIDHNEHMNVCYYQYVFQQALNRYWKHILEQDNNTGTDLAILPKSIHIRYLSEALLGQLIAVDSFIYKLDYEGFAVFQEMKRDDTAICMFNQHVKFCTSGEALIRRCDNSTYDILFSIVKNTDISLPRWIERPIDI